MNKTEFITMKKANNIEEFNNLISHYKDFYIDLDNKELFKRACQLQDDGEIEINLYKEKNKVLIFSL